MHIISLAKSVTPPQLYCSAFPGTPRRCDGVCVVCIVYPGIFGMSGMFVRYSSSLCLKVFIVHRVGTRMFGGKLLKS